ncbi:MAG: response regulator [Alphaproteobacteria bacterium]|nr:response regulator [Alphaproteobacteria bacterium]
MQAYDLSRLRVLIVDDNKFMRVTLRGMLEAFGVKNIGEAEDGNAAWGRMIDFKPDIMFVDWRMEPIDGLALMKRLRTDPESPNRFMPVIMVTGNAEIKHVKVARDAGISLYLTKPLSAQSLYQRLVAAIENPRPFVRTGSYFGPDRRSKKKSDDYTGPERRKADADKD